MNRTSWLRKGLLMKSTLWAACGLTLICTGCSGLQPVQAWEKGNLAKPAMTFEQDALETKFIEHTYFSKEGVSGGSGVGGGGCGCN